VFRGVLWVGFVGLVGLAKGFLVGVGYRGVLMMGVSWEEVGVEVGLGLFRFGVCG